MIRRQGACCWAFLGLFACNNPPPTPTSCTIQGSTYALDQANPSNPCQACLPSKGFTSWSDLAAGAACGTSGTTFCSGGACLPGCLITSTFYPTGTSNPGNGCQVCAPAKSAGDWTLLDGVVPNACPNGQVCWAGACSAGCAIGSALIAANAPNPKNPCQSCQPAQTEITWSDLAPGASCADGGGICAAGSCQSGCQVDGVFFANGTQSPTDVCRSCQPSLSTTAFSPFTGAAPGGDCDGGGYCDQGSCSGGCAINGATAAPGTPNPANSCQSCQPNVNLTGWSDVATGTGCGAGGAVCAGGVCLVGCQVRGILYGAGSPSPTDPCQTCQPAVSSSSFSPFNGLPPGGCVGGQTCNQGTCEVACFINGAVHATRSYKPGDTGFCCSPKTDPTTWTPAFVQGAAYTFGNSAEFGSPTEAIAAGDFNGDGFQDLAVANGILDTVGIFLNQGDGTFAPMAAYPTGTGPNAVATGDLNGDHLDDVVVAVENGSALGILFSAGFDAGFDAGLVAQSDLTVTGFGDQTIRVMDLNGDHAPDIVVANGAFTKSVSVFLNLNDGSGRFYPEVRYDPGLDEASQVALGDFDGDGSPDIAVTRGGFNGSGVAVLFNDGNGKFPAGATFPTDNFTVAVTAGDFNADGFSDLGVGTYLQADSLNAIGDGGFFPSAPNAITAIQTLGAADLNGDGLADLVVVTGSFPTGTVNVLISQGAAGFLPASSFLIPLSPSFVIQDFNGDGAPDLAILSNTGGGTLSFTVWFNGCP